MNPIGTLFDKFEILSDLKHDEYSAVYLANHVYLEQPVILKVLNVHALPDNLVAERFKREARILAMLDHPNIIKVLDFGTHGEAFYISFAYFKSVNLRQLLADRNLSMDERRQIFISILTGLEYAHTKGVVHRDIKPENVLVDPSLQVKLSDFGLAQISSERFESAKSGVVGTLSYMAPEQIRGENATKQSDIFSCGIVACELFAAKHPFLGSDINASINNIISFREDDLRKILEPLPAILQRAISGMLRKKSEDRWNSAALILHELHVETAGVPTGDTRPFSGRRKTLIAIITGVTIVALAAIGYLLYRPAPDSPVQQGSLPPVSVNGQIDTATKLTASIPVPSKPEINSSVRKEENSPPIVTRKNSAAPQTNRDLIAAKISTPVIRFGELSIQCVPWGRFMIDSEDIGTTPLRGNIHLAAGRHHVRLRHPQFPEIDKDVEILPDSLTVINVNFNTFFGYLMCNVYPWGDIYINGAFVDKTPLRSPIRLAPGDYRVTLSNGSHGSVEKSVRIAGGNDTAVIEHHF